MSQTIVIAIVVLFVLLWIGRVSRKNRSPGSVAGTEGAARMAARLQALKPYEDGTLPAKLGLAPDMPLADTAAKLERAFESEFGPTLKKRVLNEHPGMSEAEYAWKLLELKRYLLMNAVLKGVPMFSPEVDDLWHEMLMFTREYERFCLQWNGRTVHHAPHGEAVPIPGERAWFDWAYSQMFTPTPYSGCIWRGFFLYPLDGELLQTLKDEPAETIARLRFRGSSDGVQPEAAECVSVLIRKAKEQIDRAGRSEDHRTEESFADTYDREDGRTHSYRMEPSGSGPNSAYAGGSNFAMMASAMMMFSVLDPLGYEEHMREAIPEEVRRNEASCGSSSCSAFGGDRGPESRNTDGSSDGNSSDGGHSGDSSSGSGDSSSCSSSSCSSCGGGGD
ncbi:hypothetical protein ACFFNY_14265 [Paenibacillus hodogayensis]|uniref:Uncharacterized protein n=1 Tax=Paenibacillus hodogayensis TaxID=279208 RepID=A0ABV5VWX7_9BACL